MLELQNTKLKVKFKVFDGEGNILEVQLNNWYDVICIFNIGSNNINFNNIINVGSLINL